MKEISIFLANNYIWFALIDAFVLFGLIGFLIDNKRKNKVSSETEVLETIKFDETVEELNMQLGDNANKSINSVINNNANTPTDQTETLM